MVDGSRELGRPGVAALLWALAGAAACASMAPLEPNMLEEGFIVDVAQRLLRGDRLYQDVVAFTGPLPYELLSLLFRVFGEELWVGRAAVALLHGAATAAAFGLAGRARAGPLAHTAGAFVAATPVLLFPLFSLYYYSTLAFSLSLIAGYAAVRGLGSLRWAVAAGVLIAAAALCKQNVGALLAAGVLVCFALLAPAGRRVRVTLALAAGGGLTAVVTLLGFAATGGLAALVDSLVVLPLSFESTFDAPYVNFWPPGVFVDEIRRSQDFYFPYLHSVMFGVWSKPHWPIILFTQLLYGLPFLAVSGTLLRRVFGPLPPAVWIHLAVLLALGTNLFPRTDWGHLIYVLPSSVVQLCLLIPLAPGARRSAPARGLALAVALVPVAAAVGMGIYYWGVSVPPQFGPRVPLRPVSEGYRNQAVPRAIAYLRKHTEPGDSIFVARAEPLIYFATETRNPTPYGGVIPGMREEQQRVIVEGLADVRYVVMTDIDQPVYTYYRDELPAVQAHLERYFRIPRGFLRGGANWMLVLERGADRGETVVDFVDSRSEGTAWIREGGADSPSAPFEDTLASSGNRRLLPLRLGSEGGGIDFDVEIPENAVFQGDVGYHGATGLDRWYNHRRPGRLVVSVGTESGFAEIASQRMPRKLSGIPHWTPVEADLSTYVGQRVTLRLEMRPEASAVGDPLAWWGSPRIALRPGAAEFDSIRANLGGDE